MPEGSTVGGGESPQQHHHLEEFLVEEKHSSQVEEAAAQRESRLPETAAAEPLSPPGRRRLRSDKSDKEVPLGESTSVISTFAIYYNRLLENVTPFSRFFQRRHATSPSDRGRPNTPEALFPSPTPFPEVSSYGPFWLKPSQWGSPDSPSGQ